MGDGDRRTARQRRDDLRAAVARLFRRSIGEHDVSQKALALVTGHDASIVSRWSDPQERETPSVSDLPLFAECEGGAAVARDLLEDVAAQLGLEVRERAVVTEATTHVGRRAQKLGKELHEAIDAHLRLLISRSPADIAAALKEVREAKREIDAVEAVLERALRPRAEQVQ